MAMNITLKSQPGANPEIWRIDQPVVDQPSISISQIQLGSGDTVTLTAGGCVKASAPGKAWKRYVDPSGQDSATQYFGTILLPGAPAFARLSTFTGGAQYVLPACASGPLQIGYVDTDYTDNGYTHHDDGTENQCSGPGGGPAWIEVTILRNRYINLLQNATLAPTQPSPLPNMTTSSRSESAQDVKFSNDGMTIHLSPAVAGTITSRTVYVVANSFKLTSRINAEVDFDLPHADIKTPWAVAVNIKSGGAVDGVKNDTLYGVNCKFLGDGNYSIVLNGTTLVNLVDKLAGKITYTDLAKKPTEFHLRIDICRDATHVTATGSLTIVGGTSLSAPLIAVATNHPPSMPDLTVAQNPATKPLNAVGFAVVSPMGLPVTVRIRKFTLDF